MYALGIVATIITALVLLYKYGKSKDYKELIQAGGLLTLAILLFPNMIKFANALIADSKVIDPIMPNIILHFCFVFPTTVIYIYLKKKAPTGPVNLMADILYWPTLVSIVGYYVLGYGNTNTNLWIINLIVLTIAVVMLVRVSKTWDEKGRVQYGVAVTYLLNIGITSIIMYLLGYRRGFILIESTHFLIAVLVLQVIFFWLSYGIDPQEQNMKKRASYWICKVWMIGSMIVLVAIIIPMVKGDVTKEDMILAGNINLGEASILQVKVDAEMEKCKDINKKIVEARKNKDAIKIEELINNSKACYANIEKIKNEQKDVTSNEEEEEKGKEVAKEEGEEKKEEEKKKEVVGVDVLDMVINSLIDTKEGVKNKTSEYWNKWRGEENKKASSSSNNNVYTFTGIGFSGGKYNNGGIETLVYREDFFPGDTIIFSGKHVEVYVGGKYRKRNKMQINNVGDKKDYLYVRAPKGEKFTLTLL
ncbi:hypothetical protein C0583_06475 [Candidatus Parcubacteria bacterium]|nr:MAG: hypothetical protein C0583_06475 [Candidatus Parcubacteria bacterium]